MNRSQSSGVLGGWLQAEDVERPLGLVATRGSVTRGQFADQCEISGEQARRELAALSRLGQLRRVGGGRSNKYVLA